MALPSIFRAIVKGTRAEPEVGEQSHLSHTAVGGMMGMGMTARTDLGATARTDLGAPASSARMDLGAAASYGNHRVARKHVARHIGHTHALLALTTCAN